MRRQLGAAPTLCKDVNDATVHPWGEATSCVTSTGAITTRSCVACGIVWAGLRRPDGTFIGLAG